MKKTYTEAKKFMLERIPSKDAKAILNSYLDLPDQSNEPVSIKELFRRLLSSAQNSNMKAGVIGESIGGFNNLGKALYSFNPKRVTKAFDGAPEELLEHIVKTLNPTSPRF